MAVLVTCKYEEDPRLNKTKLSSGPVSLEQIVNV